MKRLSTNEIRQLWFDYWGELNHAVVESSNLVPANDPTLLLTNAGMVQFKDLFLGLEKREYSRATTSQKFSRARAAGSTWPTTSPIVYPASRPQTFRWPRA